MGSIKKQPGSVNFQNSLTIKDLCLDVSCYFWLLWRSKYMPEQRRKVFSMSRKNGMSNQEIADKLQLSVRTVERHIYLALQELKKVILIAFFFYFG